MTSMSVFCLLFGSLYWVNSAKLFLGLAILISAFGGGMKTIFVITIRTILTSTSQKNRSLFVFNSTNENVGAVFTCNSGGYSLASLLAGFLASHEVSPLLILSNYVFAF
uniref:Uncharacterized protein n=1 Tax=Ixodes ricinus TaxID=34613 RepID=A0A6B0UHD6_IXORI